MAPWEVAMAWLRIVLTEEQQRVVNEERDSHPQEHVRRKMLVLWLLHGGLTREKAAEVAGLGRATVQRYVAAFRDGGLDGLRGLDIDVELCGGKCREGLRERGNGTTARQDCSGHGSPQRVLQAQARRERLIVKKNGDPVTRAPNIRFNNLSPGGKCLLKGPQRVLVMLNSQAPVRQNAR